MSKCTECNGRGHNGGVPCPICGGTGQVFPDARLQPTLSVPEAGRLLKLGKAASYKAVKRGEIPVIHLGRNLRVPTAKILATLGHQNDDQDQPHPKAEEITAALAELDAATKNFRRAERSHEESRQTAIAAVTAALMAGARPAEVTERSPFSLAHVRNIARDIGPPRKTEDEQPHLKAAPE